MKHMLRFYACYPDITVDMMTEPSRNAWIACHHAMDGFTEPERETILRYFSVGWDTVRQKPKPPNADIDHGTAELIDRAIRAVAIERGLADK